MEKSMKLSKTYGNRVDDLRSTKGHRCNAGLTAVVYCMEEGWRSVNRISAPANHWCEHQSTKKPTASSCDQPVVCGSTPANWCQRRKAQNLSFHQIELTGVSRTYTGELLVNHM
ncbi:hypothetical protein HAX54_047259 [Datura stramonium]|uniref:Uncharacterized protein n=1 Tax=Datura stramonium TaxID=4076 RepID=A0ABS8RQA9_DATST|nr:hypothetical protein [Datura stramonium]